MEDEKIIALYWERDESAITETRGKYGRYLMKIAWNVLHSREDSEESLNDTCLRAWNSMPPHRPPVLSAYLGKITREVSIDMYRRSHAQKRVPSEYAVSLSELEECVSGGRTPEEETDLRELGEAVSGFLRMLSPAARNLFVMRYFYSDSLKDAAAYCGMTESGAKSLLHRTRLKLADYLREEGYVI